MRLIDTHAHLQFKAYDEDRDMVVKRNSQQLKAVINVGTSLDASEKGIKLADKIKNFYASVGVHPHHISQWNEKTYPTLESLAKNNKVIAIGEIGLDLHQYKDSPPPDLKKQSEVFHKQVEVALQQLKPVIIHCRDAYDELHNDVKRYKGKMTGVVHCFMGTWGQAKRFLDLGLYISFTGNITYKGNDYIREVAQKLPKDKILIETDAPFLSPEERRGKRNEPIYVKMVAATIANLKGWSLAETAEITAQNATDLFNFQT